MTTAKWRIVVAAGPYLMHSKVADILGKDDRYEVALLPYDDAYNAVVINDISLAPHLCIVEWGVAGPSRLPISDVDHIMRTCDRRNINVLVSVINGVNQYINQDTFYHRQFIRMQYSQDELHLRVSMALGARPAPIEEGMTIIDSHLAVNFKTRVVRKGKNNYAPISEHLACVLKYLYDRINYWVSVEEIRVSVPSINRNPEYHFLDEAGKIRNLIEDDRTYPRYVLNNRQGMYMLYSDTYPEGDPILGFRGHKTK